MCPQPGGDRMQLQMRVGQEIWIPCSAEPGPFSDERLISIEGEDGVISGFVSDQEVGTSHGGGHIVRAVIRGIENNGVLSVWVKGSFFTTAGLTHISPDMAVVR